MADPRMGLWTTYYSFIRVAATALLSNSWRPFRALSAQKHSVKMVYIYGLDVLHWLSKQLKKMLTNPKL